MKLREDQMILQYNEGNPKAFAEIYNELYPSVFYFARSLVADADAADITADAFLNLWRLRPRFENVKSMKTYLQISVRNTSFNLLKARQYNKVISVHIEEWVGGEDLSELSQVEWKVTEEIKAKLLRKIEEAIEDLPPKASRVFRLYYFDQLKPAEIATLLNISEHTVRTQKARAVQLLRNVLPKEAMLLLLVTLNALSHNELVS